VEGSFVTPADTKVAIVRIARTPPGSPIRGKLWVDNLKLVERQEQKNVAMKGAN
jgi:hypothetical protein